MLLTISTTHRPPPIWASCCTRTPTGSTRRELGFGTAHVLYPEATEERCTAACSSTSTRSAWSATARARRQRLLARPVRERPAVRRLVVHVGGARPRCSGTAMSGRSKERPELAEQAIPLEVRLPVVPCRGGEACCAGCSSRSATRSSATADPARRAFPAWGDSRYLDVG